VRALRDLAALWREPYPPCCVLRFAIGALIGESNQSKKRGVVHVGDWEPCLIRAKRDEEDWQWVEGRKHNAYVPCWFHRRRAVPVEVTP
jgi:hypothetical protein